MLRKVAVQFQIVAYPSEHDDIGRFTAHCLNLDIIADDDSVEGAIGNLLEAIDWHIDAAETHGALVFFKPAPPEYWSKLKQARRLAPELSDRIIRNANKRRGEESKPTIDVEQQCDIRELSEAIG